MSIVHLTVVTLIAATGLLGVANAGSTAAPARTVNGPHLCC